MSIVPLRTPEQRFRDLPGFDFPPHYLEVPDPRYGQLRMHYLDEGPAGAPLVLLLHGQGTWSSGYRAFIGPLTAAGLRVVVPDYVGFGRSDKLREEGDYSFQSHLDWLGAFMDTLALREVTAYLLKTGPRRFPMILPIWPDDPAAMANAAAWQKLAGWRKPVLTLFGAGLGGNNMGPGPLEAHLPGARGQPHALLGPAGLYIIED